MTTRPSIPAMILAAGRGERMRPLTDTTPKPLLPVRGKPLMQWPMEALARAGFTEQVVNTAWLGDKISSHFGPEPLFYKDITLSKKDQLGKKQIKVNLRYSHEGQDFGGALETAGGIVRVLPLLGPHFWVLAGDVFAPDFLFSQTAVDRFIASGKLAHLWLVPNPEHNLKGDFGLSAEGLALNVTADQAAAQSVRRFTYSTLGLYHRDLFAAPFCSIAAGNPHGQKAALAPILRAAMAQGHVTAALYIGAWTDVGTPERLAALG